MPKARSQLYADIQEAVDELKRQDEIAKEGTKACITGMDDLKRHVRERFGAGVAASPDNHILYGSYQLVNGKIIVYNVQNISYKFETISASEYAQRLKDYKSLSPDSYHRQIPLADYYRRDVGGTWEEKIDPDRKEHIGPKGEDPPPQMMHKETTTKKDNAMKKQMTAAKTVTES